MGTADPLQQETSHFCLPVKLCLGHSKLLLSLGEADSPESSSSMHLLSLCPKVCQNNTTALLGTLMPALYV